MTEFNNKNWFFLDGDLYEFHSTHRAKNRLRAYNYTEQRMKTLDLAAAKKYRQAAFTVTQVSYILNRARRTIYWYIENDKFRPSGKAERPGKARNANWWFSEDDVIEFRDVIYESSMRAPAQRKLPTREEVRTIVRTKKMLYVQEGDSFVPIWAAENW